jgi:hypothetical protein
LIGRLPAVHAAMLAGRIDYPKALLLSRATCGLSGEQARVVATGSCPTRRARPPDS